MKVAVIDDLSECRNEIQDSLHRFFAEHYADEILTIEDFSSRCCQQRDNERLLTLAIRSMFRLLRSVTYC